MTLHARAAVIQELIVQRVRSLKFHLLRLDRASKLAYGLIVMAGMVFVAALAGPYATYLQLENAIDALAARQNEAGTSERGSAHMAKLVLPPREKREQLLLRLDSLAKEKNIEIKQLSFLENRIAGQSDSAGRAPVRYQISMPTNGEYPALRDWLSALKQEFPTLALEALHLSRSNVNDTVVDARIQLGFYYEDR